MNTQISSKLAALAVALMMNSLIIGGVTYLFSDRIQAHSYTIPFDRATVQSVHEATRGAA